MSGASGATTLPMSRPSTTMPGFSAIIARWCSTNAARTGGFADTALTARVTSGPRISASTSSPSSRTTGADGSVTDRTVFAAAMATCSASALSGSNPARSTARVTARYIAPVSR